MQVGLGRREKREHRWGGKRKGWGRQVCRGHGAAQREMLASKTT